MQASSQRFLGQASAGASSAWMGEASVFFFVILRKLAKCQKGFFILRSQTHHLFSCSPPSTCADTSSTIASLVTSSTPSLAEGLLLCKSWTVPCSLNLFNSLVHDCHRLGVDLYPSVGWPPDDDNPVKEKKMLVKYLKAYSAWIWAKSAPWILFYSKNALWALVHSPPLTHWNFLNSSKLCQTLAEPVIFLPWVEPDPNLELLGRNQ